MEEWKVIISRKSGGGKAGVAWDAIGGILKRRGVSFSTSFTEYKYHAIELARKAVLEGYRKILTVGGDGAIHEILNGVMAQGEVPSSEVTLAAIPVGSGNDWPRLHRIPRDFEKAVDVLVKGRTMIQDVARVESVMDGKPFVRYMINIGGLGFDSYVCYLFEESKKKGRSGDIQYLRCLLKGFFGYRCKKFDIKVDGRDFYSGDALSVALGNGRYCGGGMMQTPSAVCNDALLDITVVPRLWKLKFIWKIRTLYTGGIYAIPGVVAARSSKSIEIKAEPSSYLEIDGESCGCTDVKAEIIPAAIRVVTNMADI